MFQWVRVSGLVILNSQITLSYEKRNKQKTVWHIIRILPNGLKPKQTKSALICNGFSCFSRMSTSDLQEQHLSSEISRYPSKVEHWRTLNCCKLQWNFLVNTSKKVLWDRKRQFTTKFPSISLHCKGASISYVRSFLQFFDPHFRLFVWSNFFISIGCHNLILGPPLPPF